MYVVLETMNLKTTFAFVEGISFVLNFVAETELALKPI
jgi:hypothetical protein